MKNARQSQGEKAFLGRGWSFPPAFSRGGADVEMVTNAEDIQQSLRILLGTTQGERVMLEAFGCNLRDLVFDEGDRWLMARIERTIRDAISAHEPRITLDEVVVDDQDVRAGTLNVSVRYTIRGTNSRFNMVFPFYLTEASSPFK
jgi:phage baseplate assembly protein W